MSCLVSLRGDLRAAAEGWHLLVHAHCEAAIDLMVAAADEATKGSIEIGKLADFRVLPEIHWR